MSNISAPSAVTRPSQSTEYTNIFDPYIQLPGCSWRDEMASVSVNDRGKTPSTLFVSGLDPQADLKATKALQTLSRQGPIFRNHYGNAVRFEDLDMDQQHGILTYYTRPIEDQEAYIASMPKGKWSDYELSPETGMDLRRPDAGLRGGDEGDRRNIGSLKVKPFVANEGKLMFPGQDEHPQHNGNTGLIPNDLLPMLPEPVILLPCCSATEETVMPEQQVAQASNARRWFTAAYEVVTFVDSERRMLARRQPGVESWRHPSKDTVLRSKALLGELRAQGISAEVARVNDIMGAGFTPANSLGRVGSSLWQNPLKAWVSEDRVGTGSRSSGSEP